MDKLPERGSQFVKVYPEQFAIPHAGRGQAADINRLTPFEFKIMGVIAFDMRFGGRCRKTNLEIGLAAGMDGDSNTIIQTVRRTIVGRHSHGKRMPGLAGKEFVKTFANTSPRTFDVWRRELECTAKWTNPQSIRIAATEPPEAPLAPTPEAIEAAAPEVAAKAEAATPEQWQEVFGRLTRARTRLEWAEWFVEKMRDRSVILELIGGAIKPRLLHASVEPMTEAESAILIELRDDVVTVLVPPAAPASSEPDAPRSAPRVANPAEIRGLIGQLSVAGPDGDACREAFADSLVCQFKDTDPELSRQTYLGIARDVGRGELAEFIVIEAFEEACKSRKRNRGAAFIAEVRRLKAHHVQASQAREGTTADQG